jgi:hypothetical protein
VSSHLYHGRKSRRQYIAQWIQCLWRILVQPAAILYVAVV